MFKIFSDQPAANSTRPVRQRMWFWGAWDLLRLQMPGLILMISSILGSVTIFPLPGLMPDLGLIALYHLSIYHLIPVTYLVLSGCIQDALLGHPFGVRALIYIVIHIISLYQRRYILGHPFSHVWLGFASIAFFTGFFQYILLAMHHALLLHTKAWLVHNIITVAAYPWIIRFVMQPTHRLMQR